MGGDTVTSAPWSCTSPQHTPRPHIQPRVHIPIPSRSGLSGDPEPKLQLFQLQALEVLNKSKPRIPARAAFWLTQAPAGAEPDRQDQKTFPSYLRSEAARPACPWGTRRAGAARLCSSRQPHPTALRQRGRILAPNSTQGRALPEGDAAGEGGDTCKRGQFGATMHQAARSKLQGLLPFLCFPPAPANPSGFHLVSEAQPKTRRQQGCTCTWG